MASEGIKISVILRTARTHAIFLRRALQSIADQSFKPLEVVIFNDRGDSSLVDSAVSSISLEGIRISVLHGSSVGQVVAANRSVEAACGDWIAFLDDDDTWHPRFMELTADVIAAEQAAGDFGGVVTQTEIVRERLVAGFLRVGKRIPFNPDLKAVDLALLASENRFTNNALVFRRTAFQKVGGFREDLPVLYDWEFNVRLVAAFRLELIPEMLAYYHRRPSADPSPNTAREEHERVLVRVRNEWLRADLKAGRIGLGQLALAGESAGMGRILAHLGRWNNRIRRWLKR